MRNYADNVLSLLSKLVLEGNLNRIGEPKGSLILQPIRSDVNRTFLVKLMHVAICKEGHLTTFDCCINSHRCVVIPI